MTLINSILTLLRSSEQKLEPSSVYRARLAEIDLPAATATVDAAKARRDAVLLRGSEADAEQADREVAAAVRDHDRLRLAAQELERLALESASREARSELDAKAALATDAQTDSFRCLVAIDHHASELARLLDEYSVHGKTIADCNKLLGEAGRRDDRVAHPLNALAEHLGLQVGGFPQFHLWQLPGYRASQNGGHVVEPNYRLARASELLPSARAPRRAA